MELLTGQTEIFREKPTAVTLGKFDGIHKGHQKLIRSLFQAGELCRTVFTFSRPPKALMDGVEQKVLLTNREKRDRMERLSVELLIEYPFTGQVCHMEPEAFVEQVLVKGLQVKKIITGPDFCFGYRRRGNTELLAALAPRYGYGLEVLEKERDADGEVISSTRIREQIAAGNMAKAGELLGYAYTVTGAAYGPEPSFYLAPPPEKLLPPEGIYRVGIEAGGRQSAGTAKIFTIEGQKRIETVPEEKQLFYGAETVSVSFLA